MGAVDAHRALHMEATAGKRRRIVLLDACAHLRTAIWSHRPLDGCHQFTEPEGRHVPGTVEVLPSKAHEFIEDTLNQRTETPFSTSSQDLPAVGKWLKHR